VQKKLFKNRAFYPIVDEKVKQQIRDKNKIAASHCSSQWRTM